jgi:hypothetical protein
MIEEVYKENGKVSILDIGGTSQYWKIIDEDFLRRNNVSIHLLNIPSESLDDLPASGSFSYISGDATGNIWDCLDMLSFDLIHSNSVLEHVGDWGKMESFSKNIIAFKGGYFVQTPNYWFPVEPHSMTVLFHWLPKPMRVLLVRKFSLGHWKKAETVSEAVTLVESARLIDEPMFKALFHDAHIKREKFLFMTKSLVATRTRNHENDTMKG